MGMLEPDPRKRLTAKQVGTFVTVTPTILLGYSCIHPKVVHGLCCPTIEGLG